MIDPSVTDSKFALSAFVGQQAIKDDLEAKIKRAMQRREILPHLLFCGPSEFGKRTLAKCLASEMKVAVKITSGSVIERPGDLAALVTSCEEGDLLVITECESLNKVVLELLIQVVEQFQIDVEIVGGPTARTMKLPLRPFTLVFTTSKPSQIDRRLRRWLIAYDFAL